MKEYLKEFIEIIGNDIVELRECIDNEDWNHAVDYIDVMLDSLDGLVRKIHEKNMDDFLDKASKLGWTATFFEDGKVELKNFSPCGEDLRITISPNCFIKDIQNNYESFDAEEHALQWYGRHAGEPPSIRTLLEDADKIEEMYKELYLIAMEATE